MKFGQSLRRATALSLLLLGASAAPAMACACGCGVFDIGNVFTDMPGGTVYVQYDYMDQSRNWRGVRRAPADGNDDKDIRTNFVTFGGQYLFDNGFGVMIEVPYWSRHIATADDGPVETFDHAAFGDIRLTGVYSGFFEDRDTGVTLGLKLPSGDFTYPGFDRDTAIGSGSTDLMFGAYRRGSLDAFGTWRYFAQARYQTAFATQGDYRPGDELDAVAGVSYDAGAAAGIEIKPMLQLLGSVRRHDSGGEADPLNSGYARLLLSPGIDLGFRNFVLHAEVALPVYQNVVGNQLVAPALFKSSLAFVF